MRNKPFNILNKFLEMPVRITRLNFKLIILLLFLLGSCRGGFSSKDLSGEYWYANPGNPYQVIESKKNNNYRNKIYPKVTDYVFDSNFIIAEQTPDSVAFMLSLGADLSRRFEHYELYNSNNKILEDSFYMGWKGNIEKDSLLYKLFLTNGSSKNESENRQVGVRLAEYFIKTDHIYRKQFDNKVNYWIIKITNDSIIGPLKREEYLKHKNKYGIPNNLKLNFER